MLFGAPILSSNTLVFSPADFGAFSKAGTPDLVDSHLAMMIQSQAGKGISTVKVSEFGDFTLVPSLSGAGQAQVSVATPAWITILAVNGASITPLTISANGLFTPAPNGVMTLPSYPNTHVWTGGFQFDVTAALRSKGIATGEATAVQLSFDNTLTAASEVSTIAFIMKKGASIEVSGQPVPEPSTLAALLTGALSLGCIGWRRRARK